MPLYTVKVIVQIATQTQHEAYSDIRLALDKSKRAEIVHVDSEVIEEQPDEVDEEPTVGDLQRAYQSVVRVGGGAVNGDVPGLDHCAWHSRVLPRSARSPSV